MLERRLAQCCMSTLIQDDEYVLQQVWSYKSYAFGSVHPFDADRKFFQYLMG
jgi:hypothetical protein